MDISISLQYIHIRNICLLSSVKMSTVSNHQVFLLHCHPPLIVHHLPEGSEIEI